MSCSLLLVCVCVYALIAVHVHVLFQTDVSLLNIIHMYIDIADHCLFRCNALVCSLFCAT
jgi:hypothetical protein